MPKTQKAPRVLGVVGEVGGCSLYRIIMPFAHLKARGYTCHWASTDDVVTSEGIAYDILVLARLAPALPERLAASEAFFAHWKSQGKKVVYELDDDLLGIPEGNPGLMSPFAQEATRAMIRRADLITVTNEHLASQYRHLNPNIAVLPNCIDPEIWSFTRQLKQLRGVAPGQVTVGVHGGASHGQDWQILRELLPELARRHANVHFIFAGYHPPWLEDIDLSRDRLSLLDWVPIDQYPIMVAQIDIGLCPLEDTVFNRSKSPIKFYESAMCGAPVVASPTVYGDVIRDGKTGFLAQGLDQWIDSVGRLIESPRLRSKMGAAARGHVLRSCCIHDLAPRWMQTYRTLWQEDHARAEPQDGPRSSPRPGSP